MTEIRECKFGRGVFAAESILKGTLIEKSPVIVIDKKNFKVIKKTVIQHFTFYYGEGRAALALGIGSLFNHKKAGANVEFDVNFKTKTIDFKARKNIRKGSQLFINYGYDLRRYSKYYKGREQ